MRAVCMLVLPLFLASCAFQKTPPVTQDPEFQEYISMFENMYGHSVSHISMNFATLEGPQIGRCIKWSSGYLEIDIDAEYWDQESTTREEKIALVFHELGHCALNREHDTGFMYYGPLQNYVPKSIMHPYSFYSPYYAGLQEYYYAELFDPGASLASVVSAATKPDSSCILRK